MEWEVWEGTVLMATVPGTALVGVEGLMEETEGEEAEEGTVVVVGMEEVEDKDLWEEWEEWEVLEVMVLTETVPGMVLEAVMMAPGKDRAGRKVGVVLGNEAAKASEERVRRRSKVDLLWWEVNGGPCKSG